MQQSSNYHKLKKAWLTRHSEEDNKVAGGPDGAGCSDGDSGQPIRSLEEGRKSYGGEDRKPGLDERKPTPEERKAGQEGRKSPQEDRKPSLEELKKAAAAASAEERKGAGEKRGEKRMFESSTDNDSEGDSGNESESKAGGESKAKRQPKPTFKKKQIDQLKKEEEVKPNGTFRSAKEKTKLRMSRKSEYIFFLSVMNAFCGCRAAGI